jgi:hypothetical protein
VSVFAQEKSPVATDWSFNASALGYVIPHETSYVSPTITADKGKFHLEARYNYEDLDTGSIWIGRNFSFGKKLKLDIAPMLGGVFGKLNGVAPGYTATLSFRRISLYSQSEYLIEADPVNRFYYNWSEVSYHATDWFRVGLVIQHTKAYQTALDLQRGVLAGFSYKSLDFTTYVFNFGWTDVTSVFALGYRF